MVFRLFCAIFFPLVKTLENSYFSASFFKSDY